MRMVYFASVIPPKKGTIEGGWGQSGSSPFNKIFHINRTPLYVFFKSPKKLLVKSILPYSAAISAWDLLWGPDFPASLPDQQFGTSASLRWVEKPPSLRPTSHPFPPQQPRGRARVPTVRRAVDAGHPGPISSSVLDSGEYIVKWK